MIKPRKIKPRWPTAPTKHHKLSSTIRLDIPALGVAADQWAQYCIEGRCSKYLYQRNSEARR